MTCAIKPKKPPVRQRLTSETDDLALLPVDALVQAGPFGRSKVYAGIAAGLVPPPDIKIGARCVRWRAGTVRAWLVSLGCAELARQESGHTSSTGP